MFNLNMSSELPHNETNLEALMRQPNV